MKRLPAPLLLLTTTLLPLTLPSTSHAAPPPAPAIELDRPTAKVGQTITIRLTNWPAGNVAVELCGNEARRGSADCAVASSATTFVPNNKPATVLLNIVKPPVGCPCVISVRPVTGGTPRTTSIKLTGAQTLTPGERRTATTSGPRALAATKATIQGKGPAEAWFAGSAHRTLSLTLRNQGTTPLTDPPLSLAIGRGPDPTGTLSAPALGTLAPGEERTYSIPVTLNTPAFGRYTIRGEITGLDQPIAFTASTASYPWGLPALGALAVLLSLTRTLRRRPTQPATPLPKPALPTVPALPTPDTLTMNQVVAINLAYWRRTQNLSPTQVATALSELTARDWTPEKLETAEAPNTTHHFDANELLALSSILSVPLPALLLPPTDKRHRIMTADPDNLTQRLSVDSADLLERVAPPTTTSHIYFERVSSTYRSYFG